MNSDKIEKIKIIQGIVSRLAENTFIIKGWAITTTLAGYGYFLAKNDNRIILLIVVAAILFWFLDSYYLYKERAFRCLYQEESELMSKKSYKPSLSLKRVKEHERFGAFVSAFLTPSTYLIYLPIISVGVLLYFNLIK